MKEFDSLTVRDNQNISREIAFAEIGALSEAELSKLLNIVFQALGKANESEVSRALAASLAFGVFEVLGTIGEPETVSRFYVNSENVN